MTTNIPYQSQSYVSAYSVEKYNANYDDPGCLDSDSTCDDKPILERESKQKLKVELCKNFLENRICPYKSKCKFAHGL